MKLKSTVILSIIAIMLMAFSGPVPTARQAASSAASVPTAPFVTYIGLVVDDTTSSAAGSPASTSSAAASSSSGVTLVSTSLTTSTGISSSSYSPQPGDSSLIRDKVFLDLAKSRLIVSTGSPVKVSAVISGYLPDPCHVLRIVVGSGITSSTINIQVYSLVKPGTACITVLQPFSVTVPLGTFTSGQYSVMVNGMLLGRFSASPPTITGVTN